MNNEEKNIQEALSFENANLSSMTIAHNGNRLFTATVVFEYRGMSDQETLNGVIQKNGWNQGNINISDGSIISAESHHTEFIPKFNEWKYIKDNTLTITGNSPKLGRYKASIIIG